MAEHRNSPEDIKIGAPFSNVVLDDDYALLSGLVAADVEEGLALLGEHVGLAGFLATAGDNNMREKLQLDENARVVVFGTDGATDADTYAGITGHRPENLI